MLKTEKVTYSGKEYIRTWSDKCMMLERDGALYEEAVDPVDSGRKYTETGITVPVEEAEEADYLPALSKLGVSV